MSKSITVIDETTVAESLVGFIKNRKLDSRQVTQLLRKNTLQKKRTRNSLIKGCVQTIHDLSCDNSENCRKEADQLLLDIGKRLRTQSNKRFVQNLVHNKQQELVSSH